MNKNFTQKICALLTAAILLPMSAMAQDYDGYTLIWSDEFNGGYSNTDATTGLDLDVWNFETGTGDGGWGTGQRDYATKDKENIEVSNGTLKIRTHRNNAKQTREYTSGRINSQNKKSFLYGKVEARIKTTNMTESGRGFAFWMMPNGIPAGLNSLMWPQGGEIDIFEYNGLYPRYNLGSVHYCWGWNNNQWAGNGQHAQASYTYDYMDRSIEFKTGGRDGCTGAGMSTSKTNLLGAEWHIYGINWYQDRIEFYVDQDVYHVFKIDNDQWCGTITKTDNKVKATTGWDYPGSGYNNYWRPFENPFYIILSAGVGGAQTYGGDIINGNNPNQWTCTTEIDWVRCYKLNSAKPSNIKLELSCNGNQVTATPVLQNGNAISQVEYIVDQVPVAYTATTGNRSYTFNATKTQHTIYARAANSQGYWGDWVKTYYTKNDCDASQDDDDECQNAFKVFNNPSNLYCDASWNCYGIAGITYVDGDAFVVETPNNYEKLYNLVSGISNETTLKAGTSYTITGTITATKDANINMYIESGTDKSKHLFENQIQKGLKANTPTKFTATASPTSNIVDPKINLFLENSPAGTKYTLSNVVLKASTCEISTDIDETDIEVLPAECIVYPNPASEIVNIESNDEISKVEVYSMSGTREISTECNSNSITLTVSDLPEGIHFVKILTNNGTCINSKFLKK